MGMAGGKEEGGDVVCGSSAREDEDVTGWGTVDDSAASSSSSSSPAPWRLGARLGADRVNGDRGASVAVGGRIAAIDAGGSLTQLRERDSHVYSGLCTNPSCNEVGAEMREYAQGARKKGLFRGGPVVGEWKDGV
jgi:hypothetical protein